MSALGVGLLVTTPREVTFGPTGAFTATVEYSGWMVGQTYEAAALGR